MADSIEHIMTSDGCLRDMAQEAACGVELLALNLASKGERVKCGECLVDFVCGEAEPEDVAVQVARHCLFYGPNKIFKTPPHE